MDGDDNAALVYHGWEPQPFDDEVEETELGPAVKPAGAGEISGRAQEFVPLQGVTTGPATGGGEAADEGGAPFASVGFQREATLLTNAENYAQSIRQDGEAYVDRLRAEVDELNRQAEARYEEARQAAETAAREAQQTVEQARGEAEEVRQQAYDEGYAQGYEAGIQRRYEEAAPNLERLEEILETLAGYRQQVTYYAERDSVRLAVLMARKILRQELRTNRKAVWQLLAATLSELEGTGTFRVWLNPEDHRFAAAARPSLERFLDDDQQLSFRARPDLAPGNVQIETDRDIIDLTFAQQFRHLQEQLDQALGEREADLLHHTSRGGSGGGEAPARTHNASPAPKQARDDD